MIGTIKNRVYKKYEKESSKLKMIKGGAWTINLDKIDLKEVDVIIYETKKFIYSIPTNYTREIGIKMVLGGEMKLIIPLAFWDKIEKGRY